MILNIGLYRFEFRWIPVLVTLLVFSVCARLGWWQLSRAAEKTERLAQIAHYQTFDRVSFADLLTLKEQYEPTGIEISVDGTFSTPHSWLLDNKVVNGKPGYDVLLAFKPPNSALWLLANMGWLKGDYAKREVLPQFTIPDGKVQLNGYVKAKDLNSFALSNHSANHQQWPQRTQQINLTHFTEQSGLQFYPFIIMVQNSHDFGFTYHYKPVVMAPEKHQAYATQWFLLALAALVVFAFASRLKTTTNASTQETSNDRA